MANIEKRPVQSDILLNYFADTFNFESLTVTNAGATDLELDAGYPMDANVPVVAGGEANTDGILLDSHTIPAGESKQVNVLQRGPATCRTPGIVATDTAGAALNTATIQTALEALDIVFRDDPTNTEQQTT